VLHEEVHEVDHPIIDSHPMDHVVVDDDDYMDDDIVLDIPNVVIHNPFNDFKGLDISSDIDDSYIELEEF